MEYIETLKNKYSEFSKITVEKKINKSKNNNIFNGFDGFNVIDIKKAYNLDYIKSPNNYTNIDNIKIVIIIAYSNPKLQENFDKFCQINNLPSKKINIIKVNPNTETNTETNTDWNTEICIDTQWSYGIFPYSDIYVVEAETDSLSDLLVAIEIGKNLNPDIINMSWGVDEFENCNHIDIFDNSEIIFVSSSGDTNNVQWPSTNPNVIAIGATSLYVTNNKEYFYETTWNSTGCGYSKYFLTPKYQHISNANLNKYRSTVDLSIVGNPDTGCYIFDNDGYQIYGGTSLSAPIMSGIFGSIMYYRKIQKKNLLNSNQYSNFSIQNILYDYYGKFGNNIFNDIYIGKSGEYSAQIGYDLPTGLGSPKLCNFFCLLVNY